MSNKDVIKIGFIVCFVFNLLFIERAFAYLDPGSGSLILQGLLAAFIAAGLVLRHFWQKILNFLRWKKNDEQS